MKRHLVFVCVLAVISLLVSPARALDVERYAWEFPVASDIPETETASMRAELWEQVDDILAAGQLRRRLAG